MITDHFASRHHGLGTIRPLAGNGEARWIVLWILATLLFGSLPYLAGYASQTETERFAGYVHLYPEDVCNHLSWAKQAYDGNILLEDKFNGKSNPKPLLFNALFLLIGQTARLLNWPLMWVFHLERALASALLLIVVYFFTSQFFASRLPKWTALLLISYSAGLAWLSMLGITDGWPPSDLWLTEVSTFTHMHTDAVVTPSVLLMLTAFHFGLRHFRTESTRDALAAGLATLALGASHPHNLVTVFAVFFVFTIMRIFAQPKPFFYVLAPESWSLLIWLSLFTLPIAGFHLYSMFLQPHFLRYATVQDSIPAGELFPAFGFLGVLALAGAIAVIWKRDSTFYFLLVWLGSAIGLIYTPLPFAGQYYLCQGLQIPVCLLAVRGLVALGCVLRRIRPAGGFSDPPLSGAKAVCLVSLFVLIASLSNVCLLIDEIALASQRSELPTLHRRLWAQTQRHTEAFGPPSQSTALSPYVFPAEFEGACEWLDRNTETGDVVLAPTYLSCFIPLLSGNRVYAAATHQTSDFSIKKMSVQFFYSTRNRARMYAFLKKFRIDYVLFWRETQATGTSKFERTIRKLPVSKVYENERAVIYRFRPSGPP